MMSDNLFRDLLAIYLHTLSQNKLDSDFFDSCISEYLCPDNYDISSTKVSDSEKENYWEDLYGVRYSLDGRKVISTSKGLKGVDYTIREGVLTVCDQAFQSRELHSITLPESVVAIGDRAFANNDDMEYCNIPSSVRFIYDNNPWGGCFNIKKLDCKSSCYIIRDGLLYSSDFDIVYGLIYWNPNINIDLRTKKISANAIWSARKKYDSFIKKIDLSNVIEIGNAAFKLCKNAKFSSLNMIEGIGKESFMYCESLEEIDLSKVKRIPEEAFSYCNNLKKIKFSHELQYIDKYAFKGCYNLTNIDLAKTICYFSTDSLEDCTSLTDINVNSDNEYYCSIEGVLFNKNITKLIKYPSGKQASEYEIPQSVYEIGDKAFVDCKSLKVIRCKNKIKSFGNRVFENCPNLNTCHIDIDDNAGVEVMFRFGRQLFLLKNATEETEKKGYTLIQKSASLDYPRAQWYLANIYKNGRKVEVNTEKYISWLERCASNGHYRAMSRLGREYLIGQNTTKNLQKAYELLSKLEEIGEDAEWGCSGNFYVLLGALYETGAIVTKDAKKAVQYYFKGAKWQDPIAEFSLARCYENGIGLDIDLHKAKEYYSLANKHNHIRANESLERVDNLLRSESNRADDLPF